MNVVLRYLVVILALHISANPLYAASNSYLSELIQRADKLQLHADPYWHKLVHYKTDFLGGFESEVLSRDFFNSAEGRTNPHAELEATLTAFFSVTQETDEVQNPQCRFIARYHWLKQKLEFDARRLKPQPCQRYRDWYNTINPYQLTLIFPAGTDNSPSSMFGHTLVRIDRKDQTERTRLFSYSINYAAETDETNGIIFAYKGIMGGYPGRFSIMPYYEKVNQYNQMENRDIWEYQLNFTKQEIDRLLMHAWEVGQVDFSYYFFLENCSYRLLELFDIARPGLDTAGYFNWYAIPGDTVYAALQEQGILKQAIYRPSYRTRIKHALSNLNKDEQNFILELADAHLTPSAPEITRLPADKQALILETAYDYVQYRYNRGVGDRETVAKTSYQLLAARSKVNVQANLPPPTIPEVRLDQGHGSSRLSLGYLNVDHRDNLEIKLRPAYHDLLDPNEGYTDGAQINFFDIHLRHDIDRDKTRLERFRLVDIYSLVGRDAFFKPISWKFNMGFERWPIDDNYETRMTFTLNAGGGLTFSLTDHLLLFGLIDTTILMHDEFDDNLAAGLGPNAGLLWHVTPNWKVWLNSRAQRFGSHLDLTYVEHTLEQSFNWSRDSAIRLKLQRRGPQQQTTDEVSMSYLWYFK